MVQKTLHRKDGLNSSLTGDRSCSISGTSRVTQNPVINEKRIAFDYVKQNISVAICDTEIS